MLNFNRAASINTVCLYSKANKLICRNQPARMPDLHLRGKEGLRKFVV